MREASNRTTEIGTLRAPGFRRSSILMAFLLESVLLAIVGGIDLTARIVIVTMAFSVIMGLVGGFLPSVRAARLEIVDSLRAA